MANKIKKRGRYRAAMKEEVAWQATLGQRPMNRLPPSTKSAFRWFSNGEMRERPLFSGAVRSTQNDAKMKKLLQENEHLKSAICKRELELEWLSKKWKELVR